MKAVGEVFSFRAAVLFLAGLTLPVVPTAAQQEVSPEHFETRQGAASTPKPAPAHKTTTRKKQSSTKQNAAAPKPKSKPEQSAALKTAPAPSSH